jgi:hypothetical protein
LNLALVQWYDYKSQKNLNMYGCPLLKFIEVYNFIEIEAIEDIIPRFDKNNQFFVNKYLF